MSEVAHANHDMKYIKLWGILLVLLGISIVGPMLEIPAITLITAFGIAFVKAFLVLAHFMHLNVAKRFIWYLLIVSVMLMLVFYFGVASDIMNSTGHQWKDCIFDQSCVLTGDPVKDALLYGTLR